jgi:hypothetical protein
MIFDLAARVETALAALPPDPDEIARVFTELNVTGIPTSPCSCPVANYLAGEILDPGARLNVTQVDVEVSHDAIADQGVWKYVDLPGHITEFVKQFDAGNSEELHANAMRMPGRPRPNRAPDGGITIGFPPRVPSQVLNRPTDVNV